MQGILRLTIMHLNPQHSPSSAAPAKVSAIAGLGVGGAAIVVSPAAGGPRPSASAHPAVILGTRVGVPSTGVGIGLLRVTVARVLVTTVIPRVGICLLGIAVTRVLVGSSVGVSTAGVGISLLGIAVTGILAAATPAAVGLLWVAALGIAARGLLGAAAEEAAKPTSAPEKVQNLHNSYQIHTVRALTYSCNFLESAFAMRNLIRCQTWTLACF